MGGARGLRRKHIPPAGLDGRHGQIGLGARLHQKDREDPAAGNSITENRKNFMKTKKPDDLDRYIAQRKEKDAEFAAAYDSEQAEWELGQLLAKTRESAGLTQEALARKIGSTRSAICRYERHPANLTLSTLEKVARATGRRLVVKFA